MLHQHKAAQLKRVAGATKNYVHLHGPWLSFQARHASNCVSVFPSHWPDWQLWRDDLSPTFANPGNSRKRKWIRHLQRPGSPALPQPLAQKSKAAWMSLEVSKSPVQQVQRRFQRTHKPPIFIEVWSIRRSNMTYHWSAASKHDWKAMTMRWEISRQWHVLWTSMNIVDVGGEIIPMIQVVDVQRWVRQHSRKQLGTPNVVNRAVAETARTATWPKAPTLAMKKTSWIWLDTLPLKESPLKMVLACSIKTTPEAVGKNWHQPSAKEIP